jgi:nitrogen fixation NifU-like protein
VAKYPARVKCALLGWLAFKAAVAEASHGENLEER